MKLGQTKINQAIKRMKDTNKIDGSVGGKEIGKIIDFHNSLVNEKEEKSFAKEITARNKYFWPLWKKALEEAQSGKVINPNIHRIKPKTYF